MSVLAKLIYRYNAIPVKILAGYFVAIDKLVLTICAEPKGPEQPTKDKNKVQTLTLLNFNICY